MRGTFFKKFPSKKIFMKKTFKRVVVIVIDGLGVGELPDAGRYGDSGSDTLDNVSRAVGGLEIENLQALGLGLIEGVDRIERVKDPSASYGRMSEASPGKDTSTGHWEISGVILKEPFRTFPEGFPPEMMERFTAGTGYGYLWGRPASGTEIIERFGREHLDTKRLIVYTSADSVFQIAAHEKLVPPEELYRVCRVARSLLNEFNVERVIARPFAGEPGGFERTERRRDFTIGPPGRTLLDRLTDRGVPVVGIGKIGDIFAHRGMSRETHTSGDMDGVDRTVEAIKAHEGKEAFIMTNLVDFDTLYGHRNDPAGCAQVLGDIDGRLPEIIGLLTDGDILFVTGDHGCDPTTPSTDHSREYVPLLVFGPGLKRGVALGTRSTFADLGATVAEALGLAGLPNGVSFLSSIS